MYRNFSLMFLFLNYGKYRKFVFEIKYVLSNANNLDRFYKAKSVLRENKKHIIEKLIAYRYT